MHRHADGQELYGQIDLLIADAGRFAVLDHKSFPGNTAHAVARALGHYGQLDYYADAIHSSGVITATPTIWTSATPMPPR